MAGKSKANLAPRINNRRALHEYFISARLECGIALLGSEVKSLRGNFDCWTHAMAARGALDAVVEFALNRWDIAATEAIVEEAGGVCVIRPSRITPGKFDAAFGNPYVVDDVTRLIAF